MISVPAGVRVLLATRPVDFRKGAHGLAALVAEALGQEPFSGTVIVFRAKRGDRVKVLLWDGSGLVLVWKQLQQGGVPLATGDGWGDEAVGGGVCGAVRRSRLDARTAAATDSPTDRGGVGFAV